MASTYSQTANDFQIDISYSPSRTIIFDGVSEVELTCDDLPSNGKNLDEPNSEEYYIYYMFLILPFFQEGLFLLPYSSQEVMDIQ